MGGVLSLQMETQPSGKSESQKKLAQSISVDDKRLEKPLPVQAQLCTLQKGSGLEADPPQQKV